LERILMKLNSVFLCDFSGFGFAELAIARFLCVTKKRRTNTELHRVGTEFHRVNYL
jgi:hypothetical protein